MSSRFEFGTKKVEFGKASSKISTGTHLHFGGKSKGLKADTSFANGDTVLPISALTTLGFGEYVVIFSNMSTF